MHGLVPQGYGPRRIAFNSSIVGNRQSQCCAKHPLLTVPSLLIALFSVARKSVKAVPFGVVPPV